MLCSIIVHLDVSHIESETPIFRNFWWFDQRPLELFVSNEWKFFSEDDWRVNYKEFHEAILIGELLG